MIQVLLKSHTMDQYIRTKTVIVSPKWALIFEDLKDLTKDFVTMSAATGLFILSDYIAGLDPVALGGQENSAIASAGIALSVAILTRIARKYVKESNYPHPNE